MKILIQILTISFISLLFTGCVSMRKYEDLEIQNGTLRQEIRSVKDELQAAQEQNQQLRRQIDEANKDLKELREDLATEKNRYQRLDETNKDLLERYDRMLAQNQQLLEASSDEKKELVAELNAKQQQLDQRERSLRLLEEEIKQKEKDVELLRANLEEREKRVRELQSAIEEKDAKLADLRQKIDQALLGLSAADLSVREENGKVYVSLSQNLLFRSGSKTINSEGKAALVKLARVLKNNPDIEITVEGHTDSDGDANYNWDLSVGRATSVVKELTDNGVDPTRIVASGRGEFFPVASNLTEAGKAQNRRTEIILTPKLDALYKILNE